MNSLLLFIIAVGAATAMDDGLARTPPMGYRTWNDVHGVVNTTYIKLMVDAVVSRARMVDGTPTSLADLGYGRVGLDDGWQACGTGYAPAGHKASFHTQDGTPLINTSIFPSLKDMVSYGHSKGVKMDMYVLNCICMDEYTLQADTAFANRSYAGDAKMILDAGFDGVKIDNCGDDQGKGYVARLKHLQASGKKLIVENSNQGFGNPWPTGKPSRNPPGPPRENPPNRSVLHDYCPFHMFRSGGDIGPSYGGVLAKLQYTRPYLTWDDPVSRPGCWAFPDMLEVGNFGPGESFFNAHRTHFGAWCVVSSPLYLSTALADKDTMDSVWPIISNREAIAVNQMWHGHPGRLVAEGPSWQCWAKTAAQGGQAILLFNSAGGGQPLNVTIPLSSLHLNCTKAFPGSGACKVRDIWQRLDEVDLTGTVWNVTDLKPQDSKFVLITPRQYKEEVVEMEVEVEAEAEAEVEIVEAMAEVEAEAVKESDGAATGLDVHVAADASYTIYVDGEAWLASGPTFFGANGKRYSTDDGTLKLKGSVASEHGVDPQLGPYDGWKATWQVAPGLEAITSIRKHKGNTTLSFVTTLPDGITATGAAPDDWNGLLTSFPSFIMGPLPTTKSNDDDGDTDGNTTLGFVTFSGRFIEASKAGPWNGPGGGQLPSGASAGPFALFKHDAAVSVVVSPFDTFMAASFNPEPIKHSGGGGGGGGGGDGAGGGKKAYSAGLLGSLESLPKGHQTRFLMSLGGRASSKLPGITGAVKTWGDLMLKSYKKDAKATRAADFTLHHLGYSTDNGAFYYRGPAKGQTYEATLLDVKAYAASQGIPYSYALLDSWWYYKGIGGGVKTWEPRPDIFPHGLGAFASKTGWKAQLHNRYWSSDTTYAKQNGGGYDFIKEEKLAIPTSQAFWDDLLINASTKYEMVVYEQDWLYNEFNELNATRQQLGVARDWLLQMGRGAAKANATVQYCMSYARHLLQSVELPSVSQFRASDDYGPGQTTGCHFPYCVYDIGTTSIFAWALGLAPSKDNFWSTPQPGGAYGNHTEPYNALQAAISALSTGPVQPSDAINMSDVTLIRTTHTRYSGTLLQPSRPATVIDAALIRGAFGSGSGPLATKSHDYPIWSSHTQLGESKWGHVLVMGLNQSFDLLPAHLPLDVDPKVDHVYWRTLPGDGSPTPNKAVHDFGPTEPLPLSPRTTYKMGYGAHHAGLYHIAPIFEVHQTFPSNTTMRFALLGEKTKVVPVSVHRFASIERIQAPYATQGDDDYVVVMRGDPGEDFAIEVAVSVGGGSWIVHGLGCTVGPSGEVRMYLVTFNCFDEASKVDRAPEPLPWLHDMHADDHGVPSASMASPDPLVNFEWDPTVNQSALQLYEYYPEGYLVEAGADRNAFSGLETLLEGSRASTQVIVQGPGRLRLDFGSEKAAWLEIDSANLGDKQLQWLTLSVSEYNYPWQGKSKVPIAYNSSKTGIKGKSFTYRLEPNPELYEGVRYGWLEFNPPKGATIWPWTITSIRLVCKVKPVGYMASYVPNDHELSSVWYEGAYGVRLNMEAYDFNSILMDRGDRVSIQGDGHPTMAAGLTAFGREAFPLVSRMLNATDSGCKGCHVVDDTIMAYPVYWTMSVNDYWWASADNKTFLKLVPDIRHILDDAASKFWPSNPNLVWMGWDDRLANGWCGTCNEEAQLAFATLLVRAHSDFGKSLAHAGLDTLAQQYTATAANLTKILRGATKKTAAKGKDGASGAWSDGYGLHAAANAINAEVATKAEASSLFSRLFNDTTSVCSWSPFNQYWILQAIGNTPGLMDYALASVRLCWGTQLKMTSGCFLELWNPEWSDILPFGSKTPTRPSYCHPWSSGVTHWLSSAHLGLTALTPGFHGGVLATPHVSPLNPHVSGSIDTLYGPVSLTATWHEKDSAKTPFTVVRVEIRPPPSSSSSSSSGLPLVLLGMPQRRVEFDDGAEEEDSCVLAGFREHGSTEVVLPSSYTEVVHSGVAHVHKSRLHRDVATSLGYYTLDAATTANTRATVIEVLYTGTCGKTVAPPPPVEERAPYPPFGPAVYKAPPTVFDHATKGSWVGKYGKAGYLLFGFNNGTDVAKLPSWVHNVTAARHAFNGVKPLPRHFHGYGSNANTTYLEPPPGSAPSAKRALGSVGDTCQDGCQGSVLDINVSSTERGKGSTSKSFTVSLYMVGFLAPQQDGPGHASQQAIRAMDLATLSPIAKLPLVSEYEWGVIWRLTYDRGVRLRVMPIFGGATVSAVFWD